MSTLIQDRHDGKPSDWYIGPGKSNAVEDGEPEANLGGTTAEQLKAQFEAEGKTFTDWARENGYSPSAVCRVINGFSKAKRGLGHEIAVKLGLKPSADEA